MEKIRVQNKSKYEIEVNDKGETITIDLQDTRLLGKLLNMIKVIDERQKEFEIKAQEIAQREDKPLEGFEEIGVPVTQNFADYIKLVDEFCDIGRNCIDTIFGEGASMKIFGESNNPEMFEEFITQLEPHLQKNQINVQNMKKDLVSKYMKEKEDSEVI